MRFAAMARPDIDMLQRANLGPKTGGFRFSGCGARPDPFSGPILLRRAAAPPRNSCKLLKSLY